MSDHPGAIARDAAIEQVAEPDDAQAWIAEALQVISAVARRQPTLTSDDVWARMRPAREPRAMGAAFRQASSLGIVTRTDRTVLSQRTENHRRPVRVWESGHQATRRAPDAEREVAYLKQRNQELRAENERLRQELRQLRAAAKAKAGQMRLI